MRLDNFDLNLLVALDTLLEERSVTRAARRLNVTQSAMSAALKRLRESFQDELLIQHGKKMLPTPHALALAPEVGNTLVRLKGLLAQGTRFDPARTRRHFRINASDYITTVLLAPLLAELQASAPNLTFTVSLPTGASTERLEAGEVDLILSPGDFLKRDHPAELLFTERFVVVGCASNPMLAEPLDDEAFCRSEHVSVRISGRDTYVERALNTLVPDRQIAISAQSFIQVPWLLIGTRRLSVMHERLARVFAPALGLAIATPPVALPTMDEMMQFHTARANDAGLVWLRHTLKAFAAKA